LHRPYNTDEPNRILEILNVLQALDAKIIFSIHPRTLAKMAAFGISTDSFSNIKFINPVGYIESLSYQKYSKAIITDSGGIQKEAYMLKKKCITIRSETEWVETLKSGWNSLVFDDLTSISDKLKTEPGPYIDNMYGDGHAAEKMVEIIRQIVV
jgi:UDP-GlcNAc3NAcA epimerase